MLFLFFGLMLFGIFRSHERRLLVSLVGCFAITSYRILHFGFDDGPGFSGFAHHLSHEWVMVINICMLIVGFELMSQYFSASKVPIILPKYLPDDWVGGLVLLFIAFVGSAFLDNIAASMIAGSIATAVYRGRVYTGFVVAIVMAANTGGAGSVVGDTTSTMAWLAGYSPSSLLPAYIGSITAFCFFAPIAAKQQQKYSAIMKDPPDASLKVDTVYLKIVVFMLLMAAGTNIVINEYFKSRANDLPWIGIALWIAILVSAFVRQPHWASMKGASKSAVFLSSLILSASMMPIKELPTLTPEVTIGLGFASGWVDNIPLTALALKLGGFIIALLVYSVGTGGTFTPFGSSAGVAICNEFPQARDTWQWMKTGWFVTPAFLIGAGAILLYTKLF